MICLSTKVTALSAASICNAAAAYAAESESNERDEWRVMVLDATFGGGVVAAIGALALRTPSIEAIRSSALHGVMASVATDWLLATHRIVASLSSSSSSTTLCWRALGYIDCFIDSLLAAIQLVSC
jgi:hypothetical protein